MHASRDSAVSEAVTSPFSQCLFEKKNCLDATILFLLLQYLHQLPSKFKNVLPLLYQRHQ